MCIQGRRNIGRALNARPCSYAGEHTAQTQCIIVYGIPQREKFTHDI